MPEATQAAVSNNQFHRVQSVEKTRSYGNQRLNNSAVSKPIPSTQNRQNDSVRISAQGREMLMKMAKASQASVESDASKHARQRAEANTTDQVPQGANKGHSPKETLQEKTSQITDEQKKADNKRIEDSLKRMKEDMQGYKKFVEEGYKYEDKDSVKLTAANIKTTMERYKPTEDFITSMGNIIKSFVNFEKPE